MQTCVVDALQKEIDACNVFIGNRPRESCEIVERAMCLMEQYKSYYTQQHRCIHCEAVPSAYNMWQVD